MITKYNRHIKVKTDDEREIDSLELELDIQRFKIEHRELHNSEPELPDIIDKLSHIHCEKAIKMFWLQTTK